MHSIVGTETIRWKYLVLKVLGVEVTGQEIGDGNLLAQVDVTDFTADALDIKTPLVIQSLGKNLN